MMEWAKTQVNRFNRTEKVFKDEMQYLIDVLSVNPNIEMPELKSKTKEKLQGWLLSDLLELLVYKQFKHSIIETLKTMMKLNRPSYYSKL